MTMCHQAQGTKLAWIDLLSNLRLFFASLGGGLVDTVVKALFKQSTHQLARATATFVTQSPVVDPFPPVK